MKAAIVIGNQPPAYADFAEPDEGAGGIVVEVRAAALTNLDVAVAERRHYFAPDHERFVVGKEVVAATASGERLYFNSLAIVAPFGSMAERTLVRREFGLPIPDAVPDVLAAALGNAGLAAWLPLSWRARLRPGETVLILGATGASGLIAVAAAKLLGAGRVIAAGRNPEALAKARRLGADAVVRLDPTVDLATALRDIGETAIDVVVDYINGKPAEQALPAMATGGRMVQVGTMAGPGIYLHAQTARRAALDVLGFAYYHAPLADQIAAYEQLCRHAMSGAIEIAVAVMPLREIAEAWRRHKEGAGPRIVLVPEGSAVVVETG